jgi:hypothetical protein
MGVGVYGNLHYGRVADDSPGGVSIPISIRTSNKPRIF